MYLLVFIQNLLVHLAEKILLMRPPTFEGDYPAPQENSARRAIAKPARTGFNEEKNLVTAG